MNDNTRYNIKDNLLAFGPLLFIWVILALISSVVAASIIVVVGYVAVAMLSLLVVAGFNDWNFG